MDTYMVFFRILHIFSGIVWVGAGIFMALVVGPTAARVGKDGAPFLFTMYGYSMLNRMFAAAAVLTTLAGLALYERASNQFDADWMSSSQGIVLSIGAVAGLLAFGHGFALSRYNNRLEAFSREALQTQGQLSAEQAATYQQLQGKLISNGRISLLLMIIAVIGMSAARYV